MVDALRNVLQARPAVEVIWEWLHAVHDPEIPALSVVDLGIVRDIAWNADQTCAVTVTPTYSGCPAAAVIQSRIREELESHGISGIQVQVQLSPPWTTDWLSPRGREVLHQSGIAPPASRGLGSTRDILPILPCTVSEPKPACPRCGSERTSSISHFGSTLCKALYRCNECGEPFEYFKQH